MSDNKSQQLRDVVCDIAVHHMPHDAAQLEDEDVIGAAIQHMWWNYIDDHQGQKGLPNLSEEEFVRLVFKYIKALQPKAKHGWKRYQAFVKRGWQKVTCGVALVDPTRTKVLLVKGHDATTYGFPKGKLEEGEDLLSCALREAYEEDTFPV
ncbi:hypothetical protein PTSG_04554 [Salpingoeca rosetta]|uniref:Nudix hydrolase domain-containing protein n=1 Tax=Salpingoeca rosetta (strain ATCC 50818 / BSB-021) TaxID=946362 RepID=F2U7S0_SALR5|nr:uncharacterized protein PTSG_04554 [Salpingoeca rosetta]EGD72825.1 hypothetical protein PTSG_04554 [Salpingoeca rosetta]|eukprot:XP_004994648.1 hypothetical protein PTSG_04554 [Salpingoeca rosetta]